MEQKQAIADRLKQANNILVTVSNNPSVDQLASCIGLTLALNKLGKHATAVFSGAVPDTIEFLQPEKTLEKNTDSLRDFIIALDKAKADKLRYKVEDKVVKIFITPYKTSITDKDLDFSQGDFNVDLVLALGVHQQTDLDQAITSHGRILHDAVVATINTKPGGELGTINWIDTGASSLSELAVELLEGVDKSLIDGQMATALLTGIVAETSRFSNEKTSPSTMSISAELMAAGANQQLVATKLEASAPPPPPTPPLHQQGPSEAPQEVKPEDSHTAADGTLEITHSGHDEHSAPAQMPPAPEPKRDTAGEPPTPQIHIDDEGSLRSIEHTDNPASPLEPGPASVDPTQHMASSHKILQPPVSGGEDLMSGANSGSEEASSGDPLSLPQPSVSPFGDNGFGQQSSASATIAAPSMPYLPPSMTPGTLPVPPAPMPEPPATPPEPVSAAPPPAPQVFPPAPSSPPPFAPPPPPTPPAPAPEPPAPPSETLSQIEADVQSPHIQSAAPFVPADGGLPPVPAPNTTGQTIMPPTHDEPFAPPAPASPPPGPPATEEPAPPPPSNPDLASARDAVMQAIADHPAEGGVGPEPIVALNAQPLGAPLRDNPAIVSPQAPVNLDATANPTFTLPDAGGSLPGGNGAPPSVPPPMMPPSNFGQ